MKMENGSSAYLNGNGALKGTAGMVNAVSMESLDSVISATNGNASDSQAQVRTLFVSGLPVDVKPRELYLLFRAYSGYEASQLKLTPSGKNGAAAKSTPVGFVTFATRADAEEAIKKLEGVKFDPEQTPTIRLEFARSNTKVTKPSKQPSPPTHISPASMSLPAILQPPAPLVSAAHHHNMAVAQQLAAIQQQQQLAAAAVLLNQQQQHHDSAHGQQNGASPTSSLAQQQQLLAVLAAADQQRQQQQHITPLLAAAAAAGGSAGASGLDMQQHLAAALVNGGASSSSLAALSQQQQQNAALQQLLGHQQHGLILQGAGANPQLMAALAAAQQQQQLNSLQQSSVPNGQWAGTYAHHQQQQNGSGATSAPCSTIFVGNLGPAAVSTPTAVEDELRSLFGMFPGFSRIRMHAKSGAPVAFVEFSEVAQAVAAMQAMQGYVLGANGGGGGGGMRIEFAKTRMGDSQKTANEQQNGTNHREMRRRTFEQSPQQMSNLLSESSPSTFPQ